MEKKRISISAKRQITIPQKFFTMLGFGTEAECSVRGNELVIRPAKTNTGGGFADRYFFIRTNASAGKIA